MLILELIIPHFSVLAVIIPTYLAATVVEGKKTSKSDACKNLKLRESQTSRKISRTINT